MSQFFHFLGLAFIIIGILIVMAFTLLKGSGEARTGVGVGGFIGPLPFGFATSKGMLLLTMAISPAALAFLMLNR